MGSHHFHAAAPPLRKGKRGVKEVVSEGEEDTPTASMRAIPAEDGVPRESKRDVRGQPCLTNPNDGRKGVPEVHPELLRLAEERASIPEQSCEGHYWKREVRSLERVGHREVSMVGTGVPDW